MSVREIDIDEIRIDGGTQVRAELNEEVVAEYADTLADLPPVVVFHDGSDYWLADGFHRYFAHKKNGLFKIECAIHKGTKRDAVLYACGANAANGLRRTNADKRRAVETMLADAEWAGWSDREIAKRCGVSDRFVNGIRHEAANTANGSQYEPARTFTHPKTGKPATMNTSRIGKTPKAASETTREIVDTATGEVLEDAAVVTTTVKRQQPEAVPVLASPINSHPELKAAVDALMAMVAKSQYEVSVLAIRKAVERVVKEIEAAL